MNTHEENLLLIQRGIQKRNQHRRLVCCCLIGLVILLCSLVMMVGNTFYPLNIVFRVLGGEQLPNATFTIRTLRWPRMLAGLFAGFAFGIAGTIFQTILRNPLANPNIIGVTAGSSVGAVFCILVLQAGAGVVFTGSIIGAIATTAATYLLAMLAKFSISRLILIGIGFQTMLNALVNYMLLLAQEQDVAEANRWLAGSLNGVQMNFILPLIIVVLLFTPILLYCAKQLSILELGDEAATALGVRANSMRLVMLFSSVVLVGVATATTGPIAFVSFLSGPIAKRLIGNGKNSPLAGGLFGAVLVLLAELVGQNLFSVRYPVGVITGLLGAPYLIYLLIRMNKQGEL